MQEKQNILENRGSSLFKTELFFLKNHVIHAIISSDSWRIFYVAHFREKYIDLIRKKWEIQTWIYLDLESYLCKDKHRLGLRITVSSFKHK